MGSLPSLDHNYMGSMGSKTDEESVGTELVSVPIGCDVLGYSSLV